jgi:hypothetical protein
MVARCDEDRTSSPGRILKSQGRIQSRELRSMSRERRTTPIGSGTRDHDHDHGRLTQRTQRRVRCPQGLNGKNCFMNFMRRVSGATKAVCTGVRMCGCAGQVGSCSLLDVRFVTLGEEGGRARDRWKAAALLCLALWPTAICKTKGSPFRFSYPHGAPFGDPVPFSSMRGSSISQI